MNPISNEIINLSGGIEDNAREMLTRLNTDMSYIAHNGMEYYNQIK